MEKTYLYTIIGAAIVIVVWVAISRTGQSPNAPSTNNTTTPTKSDARLDKAPDFALQDYAGKTVKLADLTGKPIIINSWAAWCPFCKKELSDFVAAQKEFGDKVVIIAIDRSESLAVAKGYTDQQGITDNLLFLLDPSDSFYQSIGGFSMPETIFVDTDGNIVFHKRGPMDINEIRDKIGNLL